AGNLNVNTVGIGDGGGGFSLTKVGAGILTLNTPNTYGGGTFVTAGTLTLSNSSGSATGSGGVNLSASTTLTSAPAGARGGTVGPLTIGGLTLSSTLALNFDLSTPGGSNDLLNVTATDGLVA